ncbi:unnamed protein product [Dicrocoelium dendriticum]|nr:unnamed protein product [Dicrocoelium dendriticum]CAH8613004.1 unnamed protein product [Dicrocoelium dendriticum]
MAHGFTWTLGLTVFMATFGSPFLIGYNLAILNLPGPYVEKFLGRTILHLAVNQTTDDPINPEFLYAQVGTTYVVASAIGAFCSGWVAEILGRRNGLLFNHAFAILGAILCALCVHTNQAALLFVGRFILGLNCGITTGVAPMYLTEVAPSRLRGAIGACNQLGIVMGIVVAYVVTLTETLNHSKLWPFASGLCAVPAAISLLVLPFCPESPRFLMMKRNDEAGARKAFKQLSSNKDVDRFISELREEMEQAKSQPEFKFVQLFTQRDLRMPMLIACLIQLFQQMSGINAVICYSGTMLRTTGIEKHYIQYCVLAIGIVNVVVTIIALMLLERAGRRTLLLWPTIAVAIALLLMTVTVNVGADTDSKSVERAMGICSTCLILLFICGFALGLGPVPALIVSEIFRQGPRAAAYSISQCLLWLSNLIVLGAYPSMVKAIKGYSFLPFLVTVIVCWVFFYFFMPETRNRSFDEVARELAFRKKDAIRRLTITDTSPLVKVMHEGEKNGYSTEAPDTPQPQKEAPNEEPTPE